MAVTTFGYLGGLQRICNGNIDWDSTALKMMLVDASYVPSVTDTFVSDGPGAAEIVVDGYAGGFGGAGRRLLTGKTVTRSNATKEIVLDADDVDFGILGGGAVEVPVSAGVIVRENTDDTNSPLMFYVQFADRTTDGTNFTVIFNTDGVWRLLTSEEEIVLA